MSEKNTIERADQPRTRQSLAADLRRLGVASGMTLVVHSSLSAIGWVSGGPVAVIQALQDVLTAAGTLVMPAHSGDYSDPTDWENPPVPADWIPIIKETMPAYDPRLTPTRGMGRIAETFRTWPGVRRSDHPQGSFAAWGRHADLVTAGHSLDFAFGENSPLARVYDLAGHVLLLGVSHSNNTSLHLGEIRSGVRGERTGASPITVDGQRTWHVFRELDYDEDVFDALGADFEATGRTAIGRIGSAQSRLFSQPAAVDFAAAWLRRQEELKLANE